MRLTERAIYLHGLAMQLRLIGCWAMAEYVTELLIEEVGRG